MIKKSNNNRYKELWIQEYYKDYNLQLINLNITQEYLKYIKELEYF